MIREHLLHDYATVNEDEADRLQHGNNERYTVEIQPPRNGDIPATLDQFIRGITEYQTRWFGLVNASPIAVYEIRRSQTGDLTFQYSAPTKRLERKIRTYFTEEISGIGFSSGEDGLPVSPGDTVGGGLLSMGRRDWYPLRTEFDDPPINALTAALHRHTIQDSRVVVQILFQPMIGKPVRNWWWIRRGYQRIGYLRKEKEKLWGSRSPTPRERRQADAIEDKAGTSRFQVSIRFLVIGAGEYTPSRVKEVAGAFNVFEDGTTGQYLNTHTVRKLRETRFIDFADTVRKREFGGWSLPFQASVDELAALVSIPNRNQDNIRYSQP